MIYLSYKNKKTRKDVYKNILYLRVALYSRTITESNLIISKNSTKFNVNSAGSGEGIKLNRFD